MMKKFFIAAMTMAIVLPAAAQDTYESARLLGSDLNGTARFVGMGGAMDALGADISTIGTNPAGIGLFRHSVASVSFGAVSQTGAKEFNGLGKTNMSFDQVGFVYTNRISGKSFINFGFNYHKSRNFDQILSAANNLNNVSSNAQSYSKAAIGNAVAGGYSLAFNNQGDAMGYESKYSDYRAKTFSQLDYLNANVVMLDPDDFNFYCIGADAFEFDRAHRGWISNFDFNISGNTDDRFYWGITVGVKDVNYKGHSEYLEGLSYSDGFDAGIIAYQDDRKIDGTGFDITAGVIVRPVEESPFRIGISIATPTFYNLTSSNTSDILNMLYKEVDENDIHQTLGAYEVGQSDESYKFKYYTPWKFGVSVGHTIGNYLAIGAGYEYSDYGASQNRINDGKDYYGNEESHVDELMKHNTEQALKGVSTIKVGAEFKPTPELSVRAGYNYVSEAYSKDGFRDMSINSLGVMYSSTSDYTNWNSTNRFTGGVGYRVGPLNIDLAYQYSTTKGTFYPFQQYDANKVTGTQVKNDRHQFLLTLGYTF